MYKRVTGTKDILPQEASSWHSLEEKSRRIFSLYNYQEIRTPLIEEAALFNRSLGEFTDIVQKQMFIIQRDKDIYALRPEGTASVVRAYVENNLDKRAGIAKLFYIGPMFRAERPQKGRLRQFNHIGCEVIGSTDPLIDVEVIALAQDLLKNLSIEGYTIKLNTLGCADDKKRLTELLRKKLQNKTADFCQDCQRRLEGNILRVLDCKNEACRKIVNDLGIANSYLCAQCQQRFEIVKNGLTQAQVKYELTPHLVRGLDYYTGTVFEITHEALGSQDALGAGGRYDSLVKDLGGPQLGAIGFALGVERLMLTAVQLTEEKNNNLVYLIMLGELAKQQGMRLLTELRNAGIPADTDYEGRSIKGAMRLANDLGARIVLILGDNEIKNNAVTLKDMNTGQQQEIKQEELVNFLQRGR